MTDAIQDLWSERDRAAVVNLQRAVADGDLLSALLAAEGASPAAGLEAAKMLARMTAEVRLALDVARSEGGGACDNVEVLASVLAGLFDLRGAPDDDYYTLTSNHLTGVLRARRGNPITLASVWVLVGQAAGLDVRGVDFPGHYFAMVDGRFVDAFAGGIELASEQMRVLAERIVPNTRFDHAWVAATSTGPTIERVLRNMVRAHRLANDIFGAYRALRLHAGLRPSDAVMHLEVAVMTESLGAWNEARTLYRDIIRVFPDSREAQVAELRRLEMQQRQRTLH